MLLHFHHSGGESPAVGWCGGRLDLKPQKFPNRLNFHQIAPIVITSRPLQLKYPTLCRYIEGHDPMTTAHQTAAAPSFRESVDMMFNRAVALMDLSPGLE